MYIRTNIHGYRLIKYLKKKKYIYIYTHTHTHIYSVYTIHLAKLQKGKSHSKIHCI